MAKQTFEKSITTNSDRFHKLTATQRALYFDLLGGADSDGMIGNMAILRSYAHATQKDVSKLIEQGYLIDFGTGTYCIAQWWQHNSDSIKNIKKGYHATLHQREYEMLTLTAERLYTMRGECAQDAQTDNRSAAERAESAHAENTPTPQANTESLYIKDSEQICGAQANDKVSKSKVKENKVSSSKSENAAAKGGAPTTTTTTEKQFFDLLTLWNDNRATLKITAEEMQQHINILNQLISQYGYAAIAETIYKLSDKAYFVQKRKINYQWFLIPDIYQKVISGQYDQTERQLFPDDEYSQKYESWITSGCALTFEEHQKEERDRIEAEERAAAEQQAAREQAEAVERQKQEQLEAERQKQEVEAKQEAEARRAAELEQWRKENNRPDAEYSEMALAKLQQNMFRQKK